MQEINIINTFPVKQKVMTSETPAAAEDKGSVIAFKVVPQRPYKNQRPIA